MESLGAKDHPQTHELEIVSEAHNKAGVGHQKTLQKIKLIVNEVRKCLVNVSHTLQLYHKYKCQQKQNTTAPGGRPHLHLALFGE